MHAKDMCLFRRKVVDFNPEASLVDTLRVRSQLSVFLGGPQDSTSTLIAPMLYPSSGKNQISTRPVIAYDETSAGAVPFQCSSSTYGLRFL